MEVFSKWSENVIKWKKMIPFTSFTLQETRLCKCENVEKEHKHAYVVISINSTHTYTHMYTCMCGHFITLQILRKLGQSLVQKPLFRIP